MLENKIERRLVERAKQAGGMAIKWVAPAMAGVPDRIVFLPAGVVIFVELKAPGKQSTPLQVRIQQMLRDLGAKVYQIDSLEAVDKLIASHT
jgi:Holliday junction resolvase